MTRAEAANAPVKLLWIEGEGAEEFADLIGAEGRFTNNADGFGFMPAGRGDWVTFAGPKLVNENTRITVRSALGLTYVFRKLAPVFVPAV